MNTRVIFLLVFSAAMLAMGAAPTSQPKRWTYNDRKVDDEWMQGMHKRFADKIAEVDGRFYDVGRELLEKPPVTANPPAVGALRDVTGKIVKTLEEDSALVQQTTPGTRAVTFYVRGLDPKRTVVDADFQDRVIYTGTHDDEGEKIQAYKVFEPLTREQFDAAIESGFKLVKYEMQIKKVKRRVATGTGFNVGNSTQVVEEKKIVETPIR